MHSADSSNCSNPFPQELQTSLTLSWKDHTLERWKEIQYLSWMCSDFLARQTANCTKLWWWCAEDPGFTEASISQGRSWRTPRSAVPWGGGHGVESRSALFLSPLHLDALESFKVNLLMSLLQWSVSLHILKYLVPMVLKICCDWELFQRKVLVKIQHVSRADLNRDCTILHIMLKLWQFSCAYNVTFHWSLIIDLKSLPCFIKNNSDTYQVQSLFLKSDIQRCYCLCFFLLLYFQQVILKNTVIFPSLFSEQCCFCLQPKLCHSLVNVPAGLFMSPFHVLHFCPHWCGSCFFILTVVIWPWSVFAPQLEVDFAWYCSFWIFLFCLREFFCNSKEVAFSHQRNMLFSWSQCCLLSQPLGFWEWKYCFYFHISLRFNAATCSVNLFNSVKALG